MSTPTSTPTSPQPGAPTAPISQPPPVDQYNNPNPLIHTIALIVTPLSLIGLFLPPRRLDLRAVTLGGVTLWGTNQLTHDYSGKSFSTRFNTRMNSTFGTELPEKAQATQARLREQKERRAELRFIQEELSRNGGSIDMLSDAQKRALHSAWVEKQKEQKRENMGVLERVWQGDADENWREQRDRREAEALKEGGGGYLGLITDQISEVLSGKDSKKEGEKKDEGGSSRKA
ncbi:hypothetical protein GGR57DRAFT_460690 [Xylariaceae sp. FL1272]|nr:hypothetical protein GGR57DRAFT_460690 [Xylariaceae sp. FL1272]